MINEIFHIFFLIISYYEMYKANVKSWKLNENQAKEDKNE